MAAMIASVRNGRYSFIFDAKYRDMDFQLRVKCTTTDTTKITDAVLCIDITICRTNSFDDWVTKCIIMPVGANQKPEKNMNRDVRARLSK